MHRRWSIRKKPLVALVVAPVLAVAGMSVATASSAAARNSATPAGAKSVKIYKPNAVNELDCNGWSKKYKSVDPFMRSRCVDPRGYVNEYWNATKNSRFIDNGHYVGHDEPSVKFISSSANSGNTMTYFMKLPKDPVAKATDNGKVVHYFELSPAPWFGLPICDSLSYPSGNACTPDSDSNTGLGAPTDAGAAFMELQFYPPGLPPWDDAVSCSAKLWCSALNIDSLTAAYHSAPNPNCIEPVNFAWLQTNGVPAGPPNPQTADGNTFKPNTHTLEMHSGDVLKVSISDPGGGSGPGLTTRVDDLTTGKSGFMVASAGNGFADTNISDCSGVAHTFHAEYATAAQPNQVPWAELEGGVLMEQEIGHAEVCTTLSHKDSFNSPGILVDKNIFDTCNGGSEGRNRHHGEGGCNGNTGVCQGAETEGLHGPVACPSNNFASGDLCEFADGNCIPQGTRTVTLAGHPVKETSQINFCETNRFQNGDLDFDGTDYQKTTWPNGSRNVPTSIRYAGPFDAAGAAYPTIQFETDAPGSEFLCNLTTGHDCVAPPIGAKFYPFWTLTNKQGIGKSGLFPRSACIWNFGNFITGITTKTFGKDAQYGTPDLARFAGTTISLPTTNPEVTGNCPVLTLPH